MIVAFPGRFKPLRIDANRFGSALSGFESLLSGFGLTVVASG